MRRRPSTTGVIAGQTALVSAVARLYHLAFEKAKTGAIYLAIDEESVPMDVSGGSLTQEETRRTSAGLLAAGEQEIVSGQ